MATPQGKRLWTWGQSSRALRRGGDGGCSHLEGRDSARVVNGQKVSSEGKMNRRKTMNIDDEASSTF
jgi:hypothetical protein